MLATEMSRPEPEVGPAGLAFSPGAPSLPAGEWASTQQLWQQALRTCEISYPHGSTRKRGGHVMRKFPLKVRPTAVGVTFTNSSLTA